MAGLRLGYAIGQPDTVQAITKVWHLGSLNTLTCAAGIASLKDTAHIADEVAENARVREYTIRAFKEMGYTPIDSHANCIFVDLGRTAASFRDGCAAAKIQVGRDFPPYEKTHSRITLGTMDEMRQAMNVFKTAARRLAPPPASSFRPHQGVANCRRPPDVACPRFGPPHILPPTTTDRNHPRPAEAGRSRRRILGCCRAARRPCTRGAAWGLIAGLLLGRRLGASAA